MLYQVPKNFTKQHNSSNGNWKIFTSPNRFENLRLQDDSSNILFHNKRADNPLFISNPVLVPQGSVRMRNQNNKRNTFASHKSRRPSICTTKSRGGSRTAATSKMEHFGIIVNGWKHHMQGQRNLKMRKYV